MTDNRTPWSDIENGALVSMYFTMLDAATIGAAYSKAGMIRAARGEIDPSPFTADFADKLPNRSRGSIEFKLMNASAAHRDLVRGAVTMHSFGYRALPNYQATLRQAMAAEIEFRADADRQRRTFNA